jgi:internalin A
MMSINTFGIIKNYNLDELKKDPIKIGLSNKYLFMMPYEIINMKEFEDTEELDFEYNFINDLSYEFKNLRKLQKINFSNNKFRKIPDFFCDMPYLHSIEMEYNKLETVPKNIKKLNLVNLNISNNYIQILPKEIFLIKTLYFFDVSGNLLKEIPDIYEKLDNLIIFDISHNLLYKLPESISNLINLRELNVSWNNLWILPHTIKKLNLSKFNFEHNEF